MPTETLDLSEIFAPTQASTSIPILAFAFNPGLPERYIDKNLQKATKLALKLFFKGQ